MPARYKVQSYAPERLQAGLNEYADEGWVAAHVLPRVYGSGYAGRNPNGGEESKIEVVMVIYTQHVPDRLDLEESRLANEEMARQQMQVILPLMQKAMSGDYEPKRE